MRLGNIVYSNCYPVHARLIETGEPAAVSLIDGTPGELNRALAEGAIDVAPCSSIEFARHADRYRILDGLAIASNGPVASILLESTRDAEALGGCSVAVPTASATSVVLLRVLLETRLGVGARLQWYDQGLVADPIAEGAAAVLRIGDVALRRVPPAGRRVYDLGLEWQQWTGLPFVFAVWQTRLGADADAALIGLHDALHGSLSWFETRVDALAVRRAATFDLEPHRLAHYWRTLHYRLDEQTVRGLLHFYALAAALGEAPRVERLVRIPAPTP